MKVSLDLTHLYELAKAEEEKKKGEEFCTYIYNSHSQYERCRFYAVNGTGYCDKHLGKDVNMGTCIEFLKILVANPDKLLSFVKSGSFFSTHHDVRECEHGQCDDCYSGDTEHEENQALISACKDIFQLMPKPIHDNTDAEDESEE